MATLITADGTMYVIADEITAARNEKAMAMYSGALEIRGSVVVVEK